MTQTAGGRRVIAIRVLRTFLGLSFLIIGTAKLTGTLNTVQTFVAIGWGQWFRYLTGLLDLTGALLLFAPRWTFYGALLLSCTVGLATVLSVKRPPDLRPALALTLLAATLAWLTRPRETTRSPRDGCAPADRNRRLRLLRFAADNRACFVS